MKAEIYSKLDNAMEIYSSCANEEEAKAKLAAYLEETSKALGLKNNEKIPNDDTFESLRGIYVTEEAFEELGSLVNGIISLIARDENPERTNNIMSLIQNNYISEQTKNNTELELAHILLPESVSEISPEALKPYVDKIRDALYILSQTHFGKRAKE